MVKLKHFVATGKDIPFIQETYHENMEHLHGVHRSADDWKQLLLEKDTVYYVVSAETPVAWFRIDLTDTELWIGMLQVKPIYHRKGVGRYILSVAESIAKEKGYKKIGIHTTEDNIAARTLYSSAGYAVTEIGPCTTADGIERVGYTFEKQVNS